MFGFSLLATDQWGSINAFARVRRYLRRHAYGFVSDFAALCYGITCRPAQVAAGNTSEKGLGPFFDHDVKASAPATTSRISWVISACRARFISSVRLSISSPADFDALRIAVIRAPCSEAADSSSAR